MPSRKATRTRAKKSDQATPLPAVVNHKTYAGHKFHIRRADPEDPHVDLGYPYVWTHEGSQFRRYAATELNCHAAILAFLGDTVEETQ